jgi:hypothetical protein
MAHTMQAGHHPLREEVASDDTNLDGATSSLTYNWTDKPTAAVKVGEETNAALIRFTGKAAEDKTFSWRVYVYKEGGPAKYVAHGTGALGAAIVSGTEYHADTLSISGRGWFKGVKAIDSGNDRIAYLAFDLCGHKWIYVEIDDIGGAGECTEVSTYLTTF